MPYNAPISLRLLNGTDEEQIIHVRLSMGGRDFYRREWAIPPMHEEVVKDAVRGPLGRMLHVHVASRNQRTITAMDWRECVQTNDLLVVVAIRNHTWSREPVLAIGCWWGGDGWP